MLATGIGLGSSPPGAEGGERLPVIYGPEEREVRKQLEKTPLVRKGHHLDGQCL